MNRLQKMVVNTLFVLIPWGFILYQANIGLFTPTNDQTARWFTAGLILISGFGSGIGITPINRKIPYILTSLGIQFGAFLIFGAMGVLDASVPDYNVSQGVMYALDGLGGFASAVTAISGIVGIVAKILPLVVLIIAIIGIFLSDTPDEMQSPLIEFGVQLAIVAVFYGLGSWVGFV